MTRRNRIVLAGVLLVALVGGISYQFLRPKWITATPAEIDRVIDPILLKRDPPDPVAEKRYERFAVLLDKLEPARFQGSYATASAVAISAESAVFRTKNRDLLEKLGPLLKEGCVLQAHRNGLESRYLAKKKMLAKGLALLIEDKSLSVEDRIRTLVVGENLTIRCFEDSRTIIDFLVSLAISQIVAQAAADFFRLEHLSRAQAKYALDQISDLESETKLQPVIVGDFQVVQYPYLPDPVAYIRKNVDAFKYSLSEEEIEEEPVGNYDAVAAAKMFSDLSLEELRICDLPPSKMSTPVADGIDKITQSLPTDDSEGKKGLERWWKKQVYRLRMDQIPNSFAYSFMPTSFVRQISRIRLKARAWNQLLPAQLACAIYENDKGHLPASLSDLATDRILPFVPKDPIDGQMLRYDPKRKIIWSIGANEKDDHGSEKKSPNLPADMVVHLR